MLTTYGVVEERKDTGMPVVAANAEKIIAVELISDLSDLIVPLPRPHVNTGHYRESIIDGPWLSKAAWVARHEDLGHIAFFWVQRY